jgi:glycosyltransferase involved in cell wall biosynthesis
MNVSRFALISHTLPPSPSGQAVVLYRILSGINQAKYYLIDSRGDSLQTNPGLNSPFQLQAQYRHLRQELRINNLNVLGFSYIRSIVNLLLRIGTRTKNILSIVRREPGTTAIVACTGDLVDIPAGFLASQVAHIPFYAYIFDDFVFQWTGSNRLFSKLIAPFIFKHCAGIIAPNEFICEEYQQRYRVSPSLVRNPCDKDELLKESFSKWPTEDGKFKITYTGTVYHANLDCFRNLINAMESLSKYNLELHIYTAQTQEQLEKQGIKSKQVFIHSHVPYNDILEQQRQADILFLPLAFDSPIKDVIRTSAPGKMGEYLASGRPILAHVPTDSFVSYYFKKYQCGWVADQNDTHELASVIKNLITQPETCSLITQHARQQARHHFSPDIACAQFIDLLKKAK